MLTRYFLLLLMFSSLFSSSYGQFCSYESCYDSKGQAKACIAPPIIVSLEKNVTVSNTCGVKEREKYCDLSGGNCFFCDVKSQSEKHPVNYLVDTSDLTWWQSQNWLDTNKAGLSTNTEPLQVNITLNFGKSYIISGHIQITFYSERPKALIVERSVDDGHTWSVLQYYAKRCDRFYDMPTENNVIASNPFKITCSEKYSTAIPRKYGKVVYRGDERYQVCNFMSHEVQSSLLATNIRVRLESPATDGLEVHGNPNDLMKYYYAISDIEINGRCFCHGHSNTCIGTRLDRRCKCEHNAMGKDCEMCQPLFNNRPWMAANGTHGNECQECNCNNRGTACLYNATLGYGQCTGCRNNTEGIHCEKCVDMYYRDLKKPLNDTGACVACDCFPAGITNNGSCLQNATSTHPIGQCACKANVSGRQCDQCNPGHWGLTVAPVGECKDCKCNTLGAKNASKECNQFTGQCDCKHSIQGQYCQECKHGYYRFPKSHAEGCRMCPCDLGGAYPGCHRETGSCHCRHGVDGQHCTYPFPGRFYPATDYLLYEAETAKGSFTPVTPATGMGSDFTGRGYADISHGKLVHFENINVKVTHKYHVTIRYSVSGRCTDGVVSLNITGPNVDKVEVIPASGIRSGTGQAGQVPELIDLDSSEDYNITVRYNGSSCKMLIDSLVLMPYVNDTRAFTMSDAQYQKTLLQCVTTRASLSTILTEPSNCSRLVFSASTELYNGTLACNCNNQGSINGSYCAPYGGQCRCKPGVGGRDCGHCLPGYHGFSNNGCKKCKCSSAGSVGSVCAVETGTCKCKADVTGGNCDQCKANYFNLDTSNSQGCQECFGYGHSTGCTSATGFVSSFTTTKFDSSSDRLRGWRAVQKDGTAVNMVDSFKNGLVITTPPSPGEVYLEAPKQYLGNKRYSYKQKLSISMEISATNASMLIASDVIIRGHGLNASLSIYPTPSKDITEYYAILDEHHMTSSGRLTPFQFQSMLADVTILYIRATYYPLSSVTFRNISLAHAVENKMAPLYDQVGNVENATCHRNYTGLSCEKCAEGYKREIPNGDPFGRCILCSCNGRSTTCDGQSGNCTNCQVGTYGDKCQYCENNVLGPNCTECKSGYWGLSRSGCKACSCHTPGTWYSNSTVCDKVTGQCACNTTMNVNGRQCDRCEENAYNATPGISDCRECSSCYGFVQTDVHHLRTQATQLTNFTKDHAQHPVMQHSKNFIERLHEVLTAVRSLTTKVAKAASDDSAFAIRWAGLTKELDSLENKVKFNLSSAVNASSEISSKVQEDQKMISETITQIIDLVSNGYRLMNTTVLDRLDGYREILDNIVIGFVPLFQEARSLIHSTQINNHTLHSGIDDAVSRAKLAHDYSKTVEMSLQKFSPYIQPLLNNASTTRRLGEDANKVAAERVENATAVLNATKELLKNVTTSNPDHTKTLQDLNTQSSDISKASSNYINQTKIEWVSSTKLINQVYVAIEHAQELIEEAARIKGNVTMQRASAEQAYQITTNATNLANKIYQEALSMRNTLKNFDSMSKEVQLRANRSLTEVFGIKGGIDSVIANASSVNASIYEAVLASGTAVQLANDAKKLAGDEMKAITNALERAKLLQQETKTKEEVIANQTVRNYIRNEIEPIENLCQNFTNAANKISNKATESLRQANETDAKSRRIIDQLNTVSTESKSLSLSDENDAEFKRLTANIKQVTQRFVSLNITTSVSALQVKLKEHKSKYEEYKFKKANFQIDIATFKRLIKSLAVLINSRC